MSTREVEIMTNEEIQIGRIKAVLYAAEEVIKRAKPHSNKETIISAKEVAYDHILGIVEDVAYCPWQE